MSRPSGSYSNSDLSRKSGDIIAEALRHPVTITQRNKPRLVLLNIQELPATDEAVRHAGGRHNRNHIRQPARLIRRCG